MKKNTIINLVVLGTGILAASIALKKKKDNNVVIIDDDKVFENSSDCGKVLTRKYIKLN